MREIYAGYTVNDGSWVDLFHSAAFPYAEQYVVSMASTEDFILCIPGESESYTEVYVDSAIADMEIPYEGNPDVNINSLEHLYLEKVGGSVFVAGGYQYSDIEENSYNVAAVWRDGVIVYEGFNNNDSDGLAYDAASIISADFE